MSNSVCHSPVASQKLLVLHGPGYCFGHTGVAKAPTETRLWQEVLRRFSCVLATLKLSKRAWEGACLFFHFFPFNLRSIDGNTCMHSQTLVTPANIQKTTLQFLRKWIWTASCGWMWGGLFSNRDLRSLKRRIFLPMMCVWHQKAAECDWVSHCDKLNTAL